MCISGLMRYGFTEAAQDLALGLLDASTAFGGRLPELFAGYTRDEFPVAPVVRGEDGHRGRDGSGKSGGAQVGPPLTWHPVRCLALDP
jgi:hypothetical protein